ncbi:MAG: FMN-binding negative transcriptional regulator [Stagnimonas sp.]|nr:FMN-binding negative transcriptional regulator [Stagnimonas sp.]
MSLYVPRQFVAESEADALALIREHPFATLITSVAGAEPHISHLPLLLEADGSLSGHMARANPHWQAFAAGHTVAIFRGPHAYISPRWYVEPAREVPTWNYSVAHVHGRPELMEDAASKLALVDRTSALFEPEIEPWKRQVEGARLDAFINAIVAFHIAPTHIESKFKMNQNKTPMDRAQVVVQLQGSGHPELIAMADWMKRHERA